MNFFHYDQSVISFNYRLLSL